MFLTLLLAGSLAAANDSGYTCKRILGDAVRREVGDPARAREIYLTVARNPMATYFPDRLSVATGAPAPVEVALYTPDLLEAFARDLELVIEARARLLNFPREAFARWLDDAHVGRIPIPDPLAMVHTWIAGQATLGQYVDHLSAEFVSAMPAQTPPKSLRARLSPEEPITRILKRQARRASTGVGSFLFLTAILQLQGPISGFVSVPLNPVNDYTGRLGMRYLSWTASLVNNVINQIDNRAGEVKAARSGLLQVADALGKYDFKGLTREQSKAVWDHFETRWFEYTQHMGKLLNGDESTGRAYYLDSRLQTPEMYAIRLTEIRTNISVTRADIERLEARPRPEDVAALASARQVLIFDRHLLAAVICDWMLNRLFYPERWNAPQLKNSGASAFESVDEYLGFGEFASELRDEIENVFAVMDAGLKDVTAAIPRR